MKEPYRQAQDRDIQTIITAPHMQDKITRVTHHRMMSLLGQINQEHGLKWNLEQLEELFD